VHVVGQHEGTIVGVLYTRMHQLVRHDIIRVTDPNSPSHAIPRVATPGRDGPFKTPKELARTWMCN
jgi:hypothetical protein